MTTLTGVSMFLIFLISGSFWVGIRGYKYIAESDTLQNFIRFVSLNLGLLLIIPSLGIYSTATSGLAYHSIVDTLYVVSSYIILAILMVNFILGIWSFIPLYGKMLAEWVMNK